MKRNSRQVLAGACAYFRNGICLEPCRHRESFGR